MSSTSNDWPTVSGKPPRHFHGIFPWTVLDATSGPWQRRKKHWLGQGVDDLAGRPPGLLFGGAEHQRISGGTSRFDPVLADIMYQWYAPHGGHVLDPFAGGITRGAIATHHGMTYHGLDLSEEQVTTNRAQADALGVRGATWEVGDSAARDPAPDSADMVLTCPPYHDLEKYSDHPADLSAMGWEDHLAALTRVAHACYEGLRDDRFLVWVVGDVRGPDGHLRQLPAHTGMILREAGFHPVNEHILITPVGTMHRMLRRWWAHTRTAGRRHQHVIVMVKGDRREATRVVNAAFRAHHRVAGTVCEGSHPPGAYGTPSQPRLDAPSGAV